MSPKSEARGISSGSEDDDSPYENPNSVLASRCSRSSNKAVSLTYSHSKASNDSKKRKGDVRHDVFSPSPALKISQPDSKEVAKNSIKSWGAS